MRCFVALELSAAVVSALLEAGAAVRAADSSWRGEKWVAEDNLHITLKFLGTIDEEAAHAVSQYLAKVMGEQRSFEITLAEMRAVPSRRRCSMVWGRFEDDAGRSCEHLARAVDSSMQEFGVEPESRRFVPHVTVVRARRPHPLSPEALTSANAMFLNGGLSMSVLSSTLYASTLTRQGPIYEPLARWEFQE